MSISKQHLDLHVDYPGYPWQVIEGDGQTLIILRHRMQLTHHECAKLLGVRAGASSWSILAKNQEKSLFGGTIGFRIYYQQKDLTEQKEVFTQAATEESLYRQLFTSGRAVSWSKGNPCPGTGQGECIFPHILLSTVERYIEDEQMLQENKNWEIKVPWQAWLFGKEIKGEPQIVRVHVAQTGLGTLLLEVLLCLQAEPQVLTKKESEQGFVMSVPLECLLSLHDDTMEEVLGVVEKREFITCRGEESARELMVNCIKKVTLVYVNNHKGGERILTASGTAVENNKMPYWPLPQVPPPYHIFTAHSPILMRIDDKKALLKSNYSWMTEYHREEAELPKKGREEEPVMLPVYPRKRPLEKWLKPKDVQHCSKRKNNLQVLTIKLLH